MADYTPYRYNSLMQLLGHGMSMGSAGALEGIKGDQALAQLIKGKEIDRANQLQDVERTKQEADEFMRAHPTAQFSIGPDGRREIHPEDMLSKWLKLKALEDHERDSLDRKTQHLGEQVEKSKIPEALSQFDALNSASAGKNGQGILQGGHLKSLGGWKNMVPDWAVGLAEKLPIANQAFPQGSAQERQAYKGVRNAAMHAQFGSRQTEAEKHMLGEQMGDYAGNSAENMEAALRGLHNITSSQGQNIIRSAAPDAVAEYGKRGGLTDFQTRPYSTQQYNQRGPAPVQIDPADQTMIEAAKADPTHPKAAQVLKDMQAKYPGVQF